MHAQNPLISDADLIQSCRDGDQRAFGQIVERYQSLVCSVAYSRCGNLAMSEDLAQEAFIQAWRKLVDLKDVTKFKSWVCTIVRNLATRSHQRSIRNVDAHATQLELAAEPSSPASDPAEHIITTEQEQLVWNALAEIPENYREPMILFYREEQSIAKVAESLELSSDAVKKRLSRGRKFLQEALAATVETTLQNSKPTKTFTAAVLLGLSGAKAKTATAGVAAATAKSAATSSTGLTGIHLLPLAQLPLMAWLFRLAIDETRSQREQELTLRQMMFWAVAAIGLAILMFATTSWQLQLQPPILQGLIIPGMLVLFYIPMIFSFRRFGKRIEQLRMDEATATPLRTILESPQQRGGMLKLFTGSGLLVAAWPTVMPLLAGDWGSVILMLTSAIGVSLLGTWLAGEQPVRSFRCFSLSLCAIALLAVAVMFLKRNMWSDAFDNPLLWFAGTMQAMVITYTVLITVVWKRVYGKTR